MSNFKVSQQGFIYFGNDMMTIGQPIGRKKVTILLTKNDYENKLFYRLNLLKLMVNCFLC